MKRPTEFTVSSLVLVTCLLGSMGLALAQVDDTKEARFTAMLKNATLKGSWAPVAKGKLGGERGDDTYRVARVQKSNDKWAIVSVVKAGDREVEFPIPCEVHFAGDATVVSLPDVPTGQGSTKWSARILFHDDVYTGRWWETANKEHAGTIAGTITREK